MLVTVFLEQNKKKTQVGLCLSGLFFCDYTYVGQSSPPISNNQFVLIERV